MSHRCILIVFAWSLLGCGSRSGLFVEPAGMDAAPEASVDAGDPELAACNHAYDALYLRCGGPILPPNAAADARSGFVQTCASQIALPGSGLTTATVDACASALDRSPCEPPGFRPPECSFRGSLETGAPCNENFQCASAVCQGAVVPDVGELQCGTCAPEVAVGAACMPGGGNCSAPKGAGCPIGAQCMTSTCVAVTYGDVGAPCDDFAALCTTGLYCSEQTGQCTRLAAAGAPCGIAPHLPGGCAAPLACIYGTCGNSGVDEPCGYDLDCAPGLVCSNGACEAVTWSDAGAPCGAPGTVGLCLSGTSCTQWVDGGSICASVGAPTPNGDGAPCSLCDILSADFVSGACVPNDSVVCR